MLSTFSKMLLCFWVFFATLASAQSTSSSSGDGYVGYNLTLEGDDESVIYSTANTRPNADRIPNPDVYLNASVHVGEIDIEVDNLTAKINLDAQVLNLLQFNAGVDLSIDQVRLLIQGVNAKVLLEARLDNLVRMINSTLSSVDLNPIIATLGDGLGDVLDSVGETVGDTVGDVVGGVTDGLAGGSGSNVTASSGASAATGTASLEARSLPFELEHNILYSTNNYRASRHTNYVLAQNGDIVAKRLNNGGEALGQQVVGTYESDMTFTGDERVTEFEGQSVTEREYRYEPFPGLNAVSLIYFDAEGTVVGTQLIAEASAGGSSTISNELV